MGTKLFAPDPFAIHYSFINAHEHCLHHLHKTSTLQALNVLQLVPFCLCGTAMTNKYESSGSTKQRP